MVTFFFLFYFIFLKKNKHKFLEKFNMATKLSSFQDVNVFNDE